MTAIKAKKRGSDMHCGDKLRWLRESRELTQKDVAAVLGTSQSYYAQYENDKRPLPCVQLVKLCEFYHVSADYLLGFERPLPYPDRENN